MFFSDDDSDRPTFGCEPCEERVKRLTKALEGIRHVARGFIKNFEEDEEHGFGDAQILVDGLETVMCTVDDAIGVAEEDKPYLGPPTKEGEHGDR